MYGHPRMRSVELPARAFLTVGRVRFLLRVRKLRAFARSIALFDGQGGSLDRMHGGRRYVAARIAGVRSSADGALRVVRPC